MKKFNEFKENLLLAMPKTTKFKFGVYSDGMFFYYATFKRKSYELSFFINKDCSDLFPTEHLVDLLKYINEKKYYDLMTLNINLK